MVFSHNDKKSSNSVLAFKSRKTSQECTTVVSTESVVGMITESECVRVNRATLISLAVKVLAVRVPGEKLQ